ncbi:metal ABC transporter ATP-binding protein [bacterium]|nr:metal ABC transporter ATP-binding protein [bacterium]
MNTIVKGKNIDFAYLKNVKVLDKISFTLSENDFVGLIGPNGGGKTTLLKIILGLLKPSKGQIKVFGKNPDEARDLIGYVPQYAKIDLNYPIDVWTVILTGLLGYKKTGQGYNQKDKKKVTTILKKLNLWNLRKTILGQLSGGQRQRVLIARALVRQPKLLLLDEPTNNVDFKSGQDLYSFLNELKQQMAVIVVSHDFSSISSYVNRVFCLHQKMSCNNLQTLSKVEKAKKIRFLTHEENCPIK